MSQIFARRARLPEGWAHDVAVTVADGKIEKIETGAAPPAGACRVDALLPAIGNLHSHAFQRAMAGMTEFRTAGRDSFWTWRTRMYRFAGRITPEQVEAIAALAFMEMLEAGYSAVGEFHYLHHQPDGAPYADIAELSARIIAAASATGIGLTLLPVLYIYGGAGKKPLGAEQARFGNDVDGFGRIVAAARGRIAEAGADALVGVAPHSLRATSPEDLKRLLASHRDCPVHIHAAEQPKEVEDVSAWLGARPVEYLLKEIGADARWCLVHATHMTPEETRGLARSGAVAGLCPVTEANLGDGPFSGAAYLDAGGAFGVGTDSNVRISVNGELSMLEYSQRLAHLTRNVLAGNSASVGETLYLGAARGGAKALGRKAGVIEAGLLADLVAIDGGAPALCALKEEQLLDGFCFAAGDGAVTDVWSAGRHVVSGGRHRARDRIIADYRKAVTALIQ
jgi:formiminoglutamate deiminase